MASDIPVNAMDLVSIPANELSPLISFLSPIIKAVGILFIFYLVVAIIQGILKIRQNIRVKKIYKTVERIERKLDKVLKEKEDKRESKRPAKRKKK
jgi:hypothetical protein